MNSTVLSLDASTSFDDNTVLGKMSIVCRRVLISVLVSIIFIGLALIVAIIFTRVHKQKESTHENLKPKQLIRYMERNKCMQYNFVDDIQSISFIASLIVAKPLTFVCTCVIVTNRHLITGAHCFITNTSGLVVRTGSIFWNKGGRVHMIKKIVKHENFSMNSFHNNIAVVETRKGITLDSKFRLENIIIQKVNNKRAQIVGWAEGDCGAKLTQLNVQIWKASDCNSYLQSTEYVCVALKNECFLNFPGLLVIKNKVIGFWVTSLTCKYHPLIFTNISKNIEWINSIIER